MNQYIDKSEKNLTEKQKKFSQEYLKDFNGTKAYQTVYKVSEKVACAAASRLLRNVKVQAYLAGLIQKQAKKAEITVSEIIQKLKIIVDRCMQACEVRDKKGEPTGEWKFDSAGAVRSLELLGKHLAMFTDKIQVKDEDLHITVTLQNAGDAKKPVEVIQ